MDIYNRVHRACLKDGSSVRIAALYFNKDCRTVLKRLCHELRPRYCGYEMPRRATPDTFVGIIIKAMGLRDIHVAVFRFELVKRRRAEAVPATHLCGRHSSYLLLNHPNNLCLSKTAL